MRLNYKQRKSLCDKYGVDRLWSFSRVNTFIECPTDYQQRYLKHVKIDTSNVYTYWGGKAHDLIQECVTGKISYDDMESKWKKIIDQWENDSTAYQFDSEKIKNGYLNNLLNYFRKTGLPKAASKIETEKPVLIKIGDNTKYVFVGYVDTQYVDNEGNLVLIDYKTSSKSSFTKSKMPEKSKQLMLYAIGKHQSTGLPYDRIKCRFDMMKYVNVHYQQENGKWKDTVQERASWVSKMDKKLQTKLKKLDYSQDEIDEMIAVASLANNMSNMPEEIQEQFIPGNYYINLDITEDKCDHVADELEHDCDEITSFESMSEDDQNSWIEINHPYNPDDYYETHLCAWHTSDEFKEQEGKLLDTLKNTRQTDQNKNNDIILDGLFDDSNALEDLFN